MVFVIARVTGVIITDTPTQVYLVNLNVFAKDDSNVFVGGDMNVSVPVSTNTAARFNRALASAIAAWVNSQNDWGSTDPVDPNGIFLTPFLRG